MFRETSWQKLRLVPLRHTMRGAEGANRGEDVVAPSSASPGSDFQGTNPIYKRAFVAIELSTQR